MAPRRYESHPGCMYHGEENYALAAPIQLVSTPVGTTSAACCLRSHQTGVSEANRMYSHLAWQKYVPFQGVDPMPAGQEA